MKSTKYLDRAIKELNLKNDSGLAREMEWPTSKISQYRTGKRTMDNEACLALAIKLGIDPMPIIMAADIDRAERTGQHSLWEVFSRRTATAASVLAVVLVNFLLTPTPSEAAPALHKAESTNVYYVKLCFVLAGSVDLHSGKSPVGKFSHYGEPQSAVIDRI